MAEGCQRATTSLTCSLRVQNQQGDAKLQIFRLGTNFRSSTNAEFPARRVSLAGTLDYDALTSVTKDLLAKSETAMEVHFVDVPETVDAIASLRLVLWADRAGHFQPDLRGIAVR